ncbi:MAG: hypothetical protein AAFY76_25275, partial [Cyanobacteria bacterium J06649_11]
LLDAGEPVHLYSNQVCRPRREVLPLLQGPEPRAMASDVLYVAVLAGPIPVKIFNMNKKLSVKVYHWLICRTDLSDGRFCSNEIDFFKKPCI